MRYARDSVYSVPVLRSQGPSIIFYMVSSQEIITLSAPGTAPIQTGEFFQQAMISFTNSTLNADAVAYSSGFQSSSAGPDVSIGLVTPDGMGNFTLVADTNSAGTFVPMQSFAGTYSVSSDGRTTTTGITSNSPILYSLCRARHSNNYLESVPIPS